MTDGFVYGYTPDLQPITDIAELDKALTNPNRAVGRTEITVGGGTVSVWTTDLVVNYQFVPGLPSLTYETLVQTSDGVPARIVELYDGATRRYHTRAAAQVGHDDMVTAIHTVLDMLEDE